MPHLLLEDGLAQRQTDVVSVTDLYTDDDQDVSVYKTDAIMEADKGVLDGLRRVSYKLNKGIKDTGFLLLLKQKGGGHYFNVGASDILISGKIKLKNDSLIDKFTADGLQFENGSVLPADAVIFATGGAFISPSLCVLLIPQYSAADLRDPIRAICGSEVADKCGPIWGLDSEGEINGCWRYPGVQNLWYMTGSFQMARFHSKHIALRM
ncbi:hypothetical protein DFH08DRAFT_1077080 [Mycena albidolilacea]|uniref:Uncharacterized protein n=1 Tax=Mycena albidolilacea TaxID=1033008 RepID=A0AAD7EW40_9AGAR|nr:hypothetical protein DFH08DRAFT_1077080 [Mycena albidolilacea]